MTAPLQVVMGGGAGQPVAPVHAEDPVFTVLGVDPLPWAATPALRFSLHVCDPQGRDVHTVALTSEIRIEPAKRAYAAGTHEKLVELFGPEERWASTTHAFHWTKVELLTPSFVGATSFELDVPLSFDMELAATKYFYAIEDGHIPLSFVFSGTVLYRNEQDHLRVERVPWSCIAAWKMPVAAWHAAIRAHYPQGGWIRLDDETLEALAAVKAERGDHAFDDTVRALMEARRG